MPHRLLNATLLILCLAALLLTFVIGGRWPLVGDAVLMHYVVFLTQHGFAPYRDIAEMNLPLTYMSEQAAVAVVGAGDMGWRLYDAALVLALVLLGWQLLRARGAAAGVFAGTIFAAVHLQDGIPMAGQRDLLVTVLEAAAGMSLLRSSPDRRVKADQPTGHRNPALPWALPAVWTGIAAALGTAAACIKPTAILFLAFALLWRLWLASCETRAFVSAMIAGSLAGVALPLLFCVAYLRHFHATAAFLQDVHGLVAYHASLERRSLSFLFGHAWSPVVPFVLLAAIAAWLSPRRVLWTRVDTLVGFGVAAGLLSYVLQGKGFPYQRYPLLWWLLLLCASRLFAALQTATLTRAASVSTYGTILTGIALIAIFLLRATHFSNADPYNALRSDLRLQGAASYNDSIQCLDTAGPCIGALYKEQMTQSTGFLYDCYLLDGTKPVVQQLRALFQREWSAHPPKLLVLTDSNCFTGVRTFDKYVSWPWMEQQLNGYATVQERHPHELLHLWSRTEHPYAYRLLLRRDEH